MEHHSNFESVENKLNEKRRVWEEKMNQMTSPDMYGYTIDEKIRETVIALNLLGINTTQSDQGNYSDSPWIQFEAPTPTNYYEGEEELRAKVLKNKNLTANVMNEESEIFDRSTQVDVWADSRDKLMEAGAEYTQEFLKYLEDTQDMVKKMQALIDEYHTQEADSHDNDFNVEIAYQYNEDWRPEYLHKLPLLMVSVPEESKSEEERKKIVLLTQAEMLRFTDFLKQKYFQEN